MFIKRNQVFDQDSPRDAIDDEMMNGQQKTPRLVRPEIEDRLAEALTARKIQITLELADRALKRYFSRPRPRL